MQALNSFHQSTLDFKIEADAIRKSKSLKLIYRVTDSKGLLKLPPAFVANEKNILRETDLWNQTCFEMFLRYKEKKSYYEFNFSLKPAWNEYYFDHYRLPQPPTPCDDILLQSLKWDGKHLEIELEGFKPYEQFEMSLAAVLKEQAGPIHYMALKHTGLEPDFHHFDSFILKR